MSLIYSNLPQPLHPLSATIPQSISASSSSFVCYYTAIYLSQKSILCPLLHRNLSQPVHPLYTTMPQSISASPSFVRYYTAIYLSQTSSPSFARYYTAIYPSQASSPSFVCYYTAIYLSQKSILCTLLYRNLSQPAVHPLSPIIPQSIHLKRSSPSFIR